MKQCVLQAYPQTVAWCSTTRPIHPLLAMKTLAFGPLRVWILGTQGNTTPLVAPRVAGSKAAQLGAQQPLGCDLTQ